MHQCVFQAFLRPLVAACNERSGGSREGRACPPDLIGRLLGTSTSTRRQTATPSNTHPPTASSRTSTTKTAISTGRGIGSQAPREADPLSCDQRPSHVELDLGVREQRDRARVPGEDASVEEGRDRAARRSDAIATERLPPDVEEVAEGVDALYRGLGMDDPVGGVRVQPHEARRARDEHADRGFVDLERWCDADSGRYPTWLAVDEDGQMGMDVEQSLLADLAGDSVDSLPVRDETRGRKCAGVRNGYVLGSQPPDRCEGKRRRVRASVSHQCQDRGGSERDYAGDDADARASV